MRKRKQYVSKYEKDAIIMTSTITSIESQNEAVGERLKNVFYVKSQQYPETGRMCVSWGRSTFNVGDKIQSVGRINEQGIFLAWSLLIIERAKT